MLLSVQFFPVSYHFIPRRSKHYPQHPVLNTLLLCSYHNVRQIFTSIQNYSGITVSYILTWGLKARIVEWAETTVARKRPCKIQVTPCCRGDRSNTSIEELWDKVFSVLSAPRLYHWNPTLHSTRVEAGSNTSTVALRVAGGNETGTQWLGV
jgi:hypothetical protein